MKYPSKKITFYQKMICKNQNDQNKFIKKIKNTYIPKTTNLN